MARLVVGVFSVAGDKLEHYVAEGDTPREVVQDAIEIASTLGHLILYEGESQAEFLEHFSDKPIEKRRGPAPPGYETLEGFVFLTAIERAGG